MTQNTKKKLTDLSKIGEFGLIEHLTKDIKLKNESSIKGVGDDGAILSYKDKNIVVTTDLLTEGIHFDLTYTPLKYLGYKSVIVNLSDVYAMNAIPKQITVALAVSKKMSLEAIDELYKGIHLACEKYNVDLIGGDTSSSLTGLHISITAIGEVDKNEVVYRNTAKDTDLICVSGDLGGAYMGLQILEREKNVFNHDNKAPINLQGYDYLLARQLKPEARKDIIALLKDLKIKPTSMIDISDGLSSELLHICKSSKLGCKVFEDKIPIADETMNICEEFNFNPIISALNGGEDYELLFTISLKDFEKVKNSFDITVIGHLTNVVDEKVLISRDGNSLKLQAQGWSAL